MKKIFIIIAAGALALSCIPDDRMNFMVDDSLTLTAREQMQDVSVHTGMYTFGVAKNGMGQSRASVVLSTAKEDVESAVTLYNIQNDANLKIIPANYYELDNTVLSFSEKDVEQDVTITWNPALLAQLIGDDTDYVIPVRLKSEDLEVNGEKNLVMVHPLRSTVSVTQKRVFRSITRKSVEAGSSPKPPVLTETISLDVHLSTPIKGIAMSIPVEIDNSLIADFNTDPELTETYGEQPEGLVTLKSSAVSVKPGDSDASLDIVLDKSKLLDSNGKLKDFTPYVIPIRMDSDNISAKKKDQDFTLEGLGFGNRVLYLTVEKATIGIKGIEPVWGKYSTNAAWYQGLASFSTGGDYSIAMDDELLYVSNANPSSPAIYAFKLSDGSLVRSLPLGDAVNTDSSWPVACVRTIPNPAGKDIVCFSSMKVDDQHHLQVWAYVNGTDKNPVKLLDYLKDVKGNANDWRRFGDRFTVNGDWEIGELWFHTTHGGTDKAVVFDIKAGAVLSNDNPNSYVIDKNTTSEWAVRDVVIYPDWDDVLITRNTGAATYRISNRKNSVGWTEWDKVTDINAQAGTWGYQFFEFHEKNFIAYAQVENDKQGRLVVFEDNATVPSEFTDQLEAQDGYLAKPVQHQIDFNAESAVANSGMLGDCCVREINGSTFVAVLIQGCGLSMFQLQ